MKIGGHVLDPDLEGGGGGLAGEARGVEFGDGVVIVVPAVVVFPVFFEE